MTTFTMRTEQEMMQELALIAVKEQADFITDGTQYSLPNRRGITFVYNIAFLDIRFIDDNRKDSVVKFTSTLAPFAPPFHCLLSELNNEA
ncbi:hypothetical protein E4T80_11415 [Muribacter muris]|uniref:Uncharacterized protein n=1 Tax=Muribacter muris TaxID=67855 RepID=A0A4Y9JSS3_9PAST|nr:hypothetical protein [Muribacter muris]MBF0786072.1 hypothetical protein [Muribacter muris]TFV07959.1 hypothetical protein E4T80_11415 [Muribacter muris]